MKDVCSEGQNFHISTSLICLSPFCTGSNTNEIHSRHRIDSSLSCLNGSVGDTRTLQALAIPELCKVVGINNGHVKSANEFIRRAAMKY